MVPRGTRNHKKTSETLTIRVIISVKKKIQRVWRRLYSLYSLWNSSRRTRRSQHFNSRSYLGIFLYFRPGPLSSSFISNSFQGRSLILFYICSSFVLQLFYFSTFNCHFNDRQKRDNGLRTIDLILNQL